MLLKNVYKHFIRSIIFILVSFYLSCAPNSYLFVRWQGLTYNEMSQKSNYIFWIDGTQVYRLQIDNIEILATGNADNEYLYIMTRISNYSNEVINLYPFYSRIVQKDSYDEQYFEPVRPRRIRSAQKSKSAMLSIFSTLNMPIYPGANASSIDKYYYEYKKDNVLSTHAQAQAFLKESTSTLIDLMLKDHTLQPKESYGGCLVFKLHSQNENGVDPERQFFLGLSIGDKKAIIKGKLGDRYKFDELDTPEDLKKIIFI